MPLTKYVKVFWWSLHKGSVGSISTQFKIKVSYWVSLFFLHSATYKGAHKTHFIHIVMLTTNHWATLNVALSHTQLFPCSRSILNFVHRLLKDHSMVRKYHLCLHRSPQHHSLENPSGEWALCDTSFNCIVSVGLRGAGWCRMSDLVLAWRACK